ncbi:MAG: DUF1028 domain-containing protein [Dehalococcoidia bacterium]
MTFSIIARDPERGLVGVAVSTAIPCVGAMVPHVRAGVGAIATQSFTNVRLGVEGLRLLETGQSPEAALTKLLAEDEQAPLRQVAGIDNQGRIFAYSGDQCVDWYGSRTGENYSVQGNMLVGKETIDTMAEAFEASSGHLALRLLIALEAGQAAGGDKRGRESAELLVPAPAGADRWSGVDIRVDQHDNPVAELRRIFDMLRERRREALAEAERLRKEQAPTAP